ncbi:hypothetical protein FA95DRAFT_1608821 [Auriscalpium vulgare]|uniref:Uncharacterized protein n=1 Tax=Auriscalpium vulgare TaxID=40419 RepID=A0ACB8RKC1_9AGAM|nr:hypothetical protein FA95DRAFT_1608821 [Auriscalpium vulgare]
MAPTPDDSKVQSDVFWDGVVRSRLDLIHYEVGQASPEAHADLLNEENSVLRALSAIRSHRNLLAPISRLPPEALTHVFWYCTQAVEWRPQVRILGSIRLTHVCRRWREAALADPGLWTCLPFHLGDQWVDESLARAKTLPLIIDTTKNVQVHEVSSQSEALIRRCIARTRILRLDADAFRNVSAFLNSLTSAAPLLEELSLRATRRHMPPMVSRFLGDTTPALRHVTLDGRFPWLVVLLKGLLSLKIVNDLARPVDILATLKHLPSLQELDLTHLHGLTPVSPSSFRHALPQLQHLRWTGAFNDCIYLLNHLTIPITTNVVINVSSSMESAADVFFHALGSCFEGGSIGEMCKLYVSLGKKYVGVDLVRMWRVGCSPAEVAVTCNPSIWFTFRDFLRRTESILRLDEATCNMVSPETQFIEVRHAGWQPRSWQDIAKRAPGMRTLVAYGHAGNAFLEALGSPEKATHSTIFMSLEHLHLDLIDDLTDRGKYEMGEPKFQNLWHWVSVRAHSSHPLRSLKVRATSNAAAYERFKVLKSELPDLDVQWR